MIHGARACICGASGPPRLPRPIFHERCPPQPIPEVELPATIDAALAALIREGAPWQSAGRALNALRYAIRVALDAAGGNDAK